MKLIVLAAALAFGSLAHAQSYYKEHCANTATVVNLKTGKTLPPEEANMDTGSDILEWADGSKLYRIALESITPGDSVMIQQTLRTSDPGPQPDQKIATVHIQNFSIQDYKVKTSTFDAKRLVTLKSATDSISSDISGTTPKYPDVTLNDVTDANGKETTTSTQSAPNPPTGDLQVMSSVTVCTTTPVQAKDVFYTGFFSEVKNAAAVFQKQFAATQAAKKAAADCASNPTPDKCADLQKKATASEKARETLWPTIIHASRLKVPARPKPDDNGSVVVVPSGSCGWTSECPEGQACMNHQCKAAQCRGKFDCGPFDSCVNGTCESNNGFGCSSSGDCMSGEQCLKGVCTSDTSHGGCRHDDDCNEGMRCGAGNICTN